MLLYYYDPILGFRWIGYEPLPLEYSKKRKKKNETFRHNV